MDRTPLHWAAARADYDAAKSLLNAGASPTVRDGRNQMPIHFCCMTGSVEVLQLLIAAAFLGERFHTWEDQEPQGSTKMYSLTLDDCKEYQGRSPLHLAARSDHLDKVQLLAYHGAELGTLDKRGRTPLLLSIYWNSHKTIAWMLRNGAPSDTITKERMTILHYAARFADLETLLILREADIRGVDVDLEDEKGHTANDTFDKFRPASLEEEESLIAQSRDVFQELLENVRKLAIVEVDESDQDDLLEAGCLHGSTSDEHSKEQGCSTVGRHSGIIAFLTFSFVVLFWLASYQVVW